jgi:MinD-like ATPase involved in chromosome partitioning or flagellar assembly
VSEPALWARRPEGGEGGSEAREGGPNGSAEPPNPELDQEPLPAPEPSRRQLDPVQRTVLLLASEYPPHRLVVLRSQLLLEAVQPLIAGGWQPEVVMRAIDVGGPPDPADPVTDLVTRCQRLGRAGPAQPADPGDPLRPTDLPDLAPSQASSGPAGPFGWLTEGRDPVTTGYQPRRVARARERAAARGWRRTARRWSGGAVRLGPGADERAEHELVRRVRAPIAGYRSVVVLSLKGGSGKTTTTVMLGHTFAAHRGDRVVAVDASPDAGTLVYRIADEPQHSVRTLLDNATALRRYVDVRSLSGHTDSRLDVISCDLDPAVSLPFGGGDYRRAAEILTRFYSLVLTDCGAGLMHEAMGPVLDSADQIVVVMNAAVDSSRSANHTLDWLESHGFGDLVRGSVLVVNAVDRKPVIDLGELHQHFGARCRTVVEIPRDPHLAEGADTDLDRLARPTRRAYLRLAAAVADGFEDPSVQRGRSR